MKALVVITGRGLGGDAVIALNVISGLEESGVQCEIALDKKAPGLLFKKKGYTWHKISIPQAGGHAATKKRAIKAASKMFGATWKIIKLIKKVDADFVVGINGGGAIVGSVGAKLSRKPAVSLISTPLDSKVCTKFNKCFAFPETAFFRGAPLPDNAEKAYYPINPDTGDGDRQLALEKLKQEKIFDESKKTILFSCGSSIFKGVMEGVANLSNATDDYNIVLVGLPLKEHYMDIIDQNKVIYLGYIDWLKDLLDFTDLAVVTDDGLSVEEAIACEVPAVALTRVKWGRYHDMATIFKGALIEAEVYNLTDKIFEALDNIDELRANSKKYSADLRASKKVLVEKILKEVS